MKVVGCAAGFAGPDRDPITTKGATLHRRTLLLASLALSLTFLTSCVRIERQSVVGALEERVDTLERRTDSLERQLAQERRMRRIEEQIGHLAQQIQARPPVAAPSAQEGSPVASVPASAPAEAMTVPGLAGPEHPERYGGYSRQPLATDPPSVDPAHITDTTSHRVGGQIVEGLVEFDDDLNVVPCIAQSWEVSPDSQKYVFHLKKGVLFHNGRECTAEDFVYSFARLLDPKEASERGWLVADVLGYREFEILQKASGLLRQVQAGQTEKLSADRVNEAVKSLGEITAEKLAEIGHPRIEAVLAHAGAMASALGEVQQAYEGGGDPAGVAVAAGLIDAQRSFPVREFLTAGLRAPDPYTFEIRLSRPFAPFLTVLAMPNVAVVPREEVEKWGERFRDHVVGTGPFRLVSWEHGVSIELEAFDDYFRGRPYLDGIKYRVLPEQAAHVTEFKIGNFDSINTLDDEKYVEIKNDPDFPGELQEKVTLSTYYIGMHCEMPPFDNKLVRQAFLHAVNKDIILNVVRKGRGVSARGVLPPDMPGYNPDLPDYEYNPEKAKELLRQAGYADPADLGEIPLWFNATSPSDPNAKLAEVIQENLRGIGVNLKLQTTDWGTYLKKLDRGELPLFRLAWIADYPDPDNFLYVLFHSSMKGPPGNHAHYSNARVDELLDRARRISDQDERTRLYQEAEKLIVEDAPWIFLYHAKQTFLHKPYLKDAHLTGLGPDAIHFRPAWLDQSLMR